jgi:hypothetical protein
MKASWKDFLCGLVVTLAFGSLLAFVLAYPHEAPTAAKGFADETPAPVDRAQ